MEKYNPVYEAYKILLQYIECEEPDYMYVIETALGYLGEALDD